MEEDLQIRALSLAEARRHAAEVEALTCLIGGACVHPPGELIDGPKYLDLRYVTSYAAWHNAHLIGVLLACRRTAETGNADVAPGDYALSADSYYLDHLAVSSAWQRRGVGRRLMQAWLARTQWLHRRQGTGPAAWSLETDAQPERAGVRAFYAGFGFTPVGTRRYGDELDVVMWRSGQVG